MAKPNTGLRACDGALTSLRATSLLRVVRGLGGFQEVKSLRKQPQIKHRSLWLLQEPPQGPTSVGVRSQRGKSGWPCVGLCPPAGTCQTQSVPAGSPAQAMLQSSENARELPALVSPVTSPQTAAEGADLQECVYLPLLRGATSHGCQLRCFFLSQAESSLFLDKLVSIAGQKEPAKDVNYSRLALTLPSAGQG